MERPQLRDWLLAALCLAVWVAIVGVGYAALIWINGGCLCQ